MVPAKENGEYVTITNKNQLLSIYNSRTSKENKISKNRKYEDRL